MIETAVTRKLVGRLCRSSVRSSSHTRASDSGIARNGNRSRTPSVSDRTVQRPRVLEQAISGAIREEWLRVPDSPH